MLKKSLSAEPAPVPLSKIITALTPCNSHVRDSASMRVAVAAGRPHTPGSTKTVDEPGAPAVFPSNPNSRRGRTKSPFRQGRVAMEGVIVGIDVSKDRLDVALLPSEAAFAVERNAKGLDDLIARLKDEPV